MAHPNKPRRDAFLLLRVWPAATYRAAICVNHTDAPVTRTVERKTREQAPPWVFLLSGAGARFPKSSYIRPYIGRETKNPAIF